jgi:hypothetical protein
MHEFANYNNFGMEYICFHTAAVFYHDRQTDKETIMSAPNTASRGPGRKDARWPESTPDFLQLRDRARHQRTMAINAALAAIWGRLTNG